MSGNNSQRPVHLFGEDERGHLVRKRHRTKREQHVGAFAGRLRKTVRWAYTKDNLLLSCLLYCAKPVSKLGRAELLTPLIKQDEKSGLRLSVQCHAEALLCEKDLFLYGGILPNPLHVGAYERAPLGAFTSSSYSAEHQIQ